MTEVVSIEKKLFCWKKEVSGVIPYIKVRGDLLLVRRDRGGKCILSFVWRRV